MRLSWQRSKILHDRISCSWKVSNYTMYDHAPLIKAKAFWTTHFNRKWEFFPFNMPSLPWRYTTCIAYCLYTWRGDLIENFGKTTAQECSLPVLPVKLACDEKKVPLVSPHEPPIRPWRPETQPIRKGWLIGAVYFAHWRLNSCFGSTEVTWKIGVLAEKKGDGKSEAIHFGFIRWIINCCAADKRFCKYDYREKAIFWNYGDEGSVSERVSGEVCSINVLPLLKARAKTRLRYWSGWLHWKSEHR